MMKTIERENFRIALMSVAAANRSRFGLGVPHFKLHVANLAYEDVTNEDVERELEWMAERELLDEVPNSLSPGNRLWHLSEKGQAILKAKNETRDARE